MHYPIRAFFVSLILAIVLAQTAYAQSTLITYSGRLTDGTGWGQSLLVDLEFRVYGSEIGDTALWHQAFPGVAVEDGFFTVLLGEGLGVEGEPLAIADVFASTSQTWLGVVLEGAELARQTVGSVPYAVRAETARWAPWFTVGDGAASNEPNLSAKLEVAGNVLTTIGKNYWHFPDEISMSEGSAGPFLGTLNHANEVQGKLVTLSVEAKADSASGKSVLLSLLWYPTDTTWVALRMPVSETYQRYYFTVQMPADATQVRLYYTPSDELCTDCGRIYVRRGSLSLGAEHQAYEALAVRTGGGAVFDVTSEGNVGIGTNSPRAPLHISGGRLRLDDGIDSSCEIFVTSGPCSNWSYTEIGGHNGKHICMACE